MLSALVGGRVGLCGGALNLMKLALITAIRYGHARKQFGPTRDNEIRILLAISRPTFALLVLLN